MRKRIYLSLTVCTLLLLFGKKLSAQSAPAESSSQQNAFNNALNLFYTSIGDQSPLYNGPEYYFYDPTIKGNAYFSDMNAFTAGTVNYDGAVYAGVPMLYDIYSDKVAVLLYNHFSKFSLVPEKVKSFDFLDHHFIYINADSIKNNPGIKTGFYDELYNGKTEVLEKWEKNIQTNSSGLSVGPESYFNQKKDFFLKKDNAYYSVSGQGSMIDVLKDHKKELQQYIKASKIKYRQGPEDAMVKIATYYDHLTN